MSAPLHRADDGTWFACLIALDKYEHRDRYTAHDCECAECQRITYEQRAYWAEVDREP